MSADIVMLGPPGAGKGAQAQRLASRLGVPAISTGDIFRANVSHDTELGALARPYIDAGEYVPDSVTDGIVRDRLAAPDTAAGFVLDGYPRTLEQARVLDEMLGEKGHALDAVIEIVADEEEIVQRLLRRGRTQRRGDDTADVIRRRLRVYAEQTEPLVQVYSRRGLLMEIDGSGSVDDVADRIAGAFARDPAAR